MEDTRQLPNQRQDLRRQQRCPKSLRQRRRQILHDIVGSPLKVSLAKESNHTGDIQRPQHLGLVDESSLLRRVQAMLLLQNLQRKRHPLPSRQVHLAGPSLTEELRDDVRTDALTDRKPHTRTLPQNPKHKLGSALRARQGQQDSQSGETHKPTGMNENFWKFQCPLRGLLGCNERSLGQAA